MFGHWISQTRKLNKHYQSEGRGGFKGTFLFTPYVNHYPNIFFYIDKGKVFMEVIPSQLGNNAKKVTNYTMFNHMLPIAYLHANSFTINGTGLTADELNGITSTDGKILLKCENITLIKNGYSKIEKRLVVYYDVTNVPIYTDGLGDDYFDFRGEGHQLINLHKTVRLEMNNNIFAMRGEMCYFTNSSAPSNTLNDLHVGSYNCMYDIDIIDVGGGIYNSSLNQTSLMVEGEDPISYYGYYGEIHLQEIDLNMAFGSAHTTPDYPTGTYLAGNCDNYSTPNSWYYSQVTFNYQIDEIMSSECREQNMPATFDGDSNVIFYANPPIETSLMRFSERW